MKHALLRAKVLQWWLFLASLACIHLFASISLNMDMMERIMQEHYGSEGGKKFYAWSKLLEDNQLQVEIDQVKSVNNFFNKHIRFKDDKVHWKKSDYWATPLETLGSGAGDCEDFTIAKYMTLLKLGVPTSRLRLIYVKAQMGGPSSHVFQAHMVLGYYPQANAVPLILDSLITTIEAADKRSDLLPVFSFNSDGLWVGGQAQPQVDPTARLSRWRDVLMRMKQEGF
ncbi:MAG: transglutaminase-like cysteine peptidase [Pseudomonadota bacterium]